MQQLNVWGCSKEKGRQNGSGYRGNRKVKRAERGRRRGIVNAPADLVTM